LPAITTFPSPGSDYEHSDSIGSKRSASDASPFPELLVKRDWEENSGEVRPQVIEKYEGKGVIYLQVIEQPGRFQIRSEFRKS
jgi:hypothetical protein